MARVTIEDCLGVVNNRFELSVLAGFRAKQIERGSLSNMDKHNDKCAVVALREIANHGHDVDSLRGAYIYSLRKNILSHDVLEEETTFVETKAEIVEDSVVEPTEELAEEAISVESYDFDDDE